MKDLSCWNLRYKPCAYEKRLIKKLNLLNEQTENQVDITEVKKATYYAKKYHGKQVRQSGEPYYSHPLEVAYMLSDYLFRTDILVTAILHDTIEDTELTFDMIAAIFGQQVANQVMDLTRIKENGLKISSSEMIENLFYQKKYDILLVKLFDRLHNIQTIGAKSPEKAKKIVTETINKFLMLSVYLEQLQVEEDLYTLSFKAVYGNKTNPPKRDDYEFYDY